MLYLGIDQHAKQLTISLRNDAGDIVLKRQVSTEPKRCAEFFAKLRDKAGDEGFIAILEVCGFNDWLLKFLPTVGCTQTILIQPTKKLKVKTDKRDAHALSELLWVNQHRLRAGEPVRGVRQVILPSKHHAESQRITLLRKDAGRMRTRATNRIKNILRKHNLQWQMPTKTFPSVRAVAWLKTVELPPCERAEMDWHLDELERWTTRMNDLEVQIIERSKDDPVVTRLRTIPGCAHYSALSLVCRVGDPHRFPKGKSLAHYWGLTPGVNDSGEGTGRRGRITKAGSTMARWVLAQITLHCLRRDPVLKAWYKPIRNRRGSKIARVAVMRKLAVIIRNMMVHEQTYSECRDAMLARRKRQVAIHKQTA
ncbi:IS110 family RNA-guided transposase [Roseimaritima ulvae]|uniref:Transposase IS116/IS110/IS902 family protein n=1 Tax=Roseimaritima ulvae TaxID=980254 RepID=A0A5B9QTQ9_9BACT|nr:IS110 family transposase [Roseimaritima ulvae]QEG40466.1 Transposase IS116/IS110/IS902 family protein [Roseimaritima ulvae]